MIGLTLALTVAATAARPTFPPENRCDLPSTSEIVACTRVQYDAWDAVLNAEYKAAMARLEPNRKPLLLKAERLWVQYRQANCDVGFAHGGTVRVILGEECMLDMTRARAKELHDLHIDDTN